MSVVLHLSDTHFGTERPAVVAALERFTQAQAPDLLLLTGDITQRARPAQFAAARAFVERLQVPALVAIPGNHDIPLFNLAARLLQPYARYRRAFGDELEPQFENDELLVLALNTTRWFRHKDGEVSPAQIERVARRLEAARPGQCRIVAIHQPIAITQEQDRLNVLHGHRAAAQRWAAAGADLIVGGHIHLPFVVALHKRWAELPRALWAVQAGTALSTRVRPGAGNSVNLIRVDGAVPQPACVVERWDHNDGRQQFEQVSSTPCALARPAGQLDADDADRQPGRA